jgi:membrane fusion protein (multidrug efflux system)
MPPVFKVLKKEINFPVIIVAIGLLIGIYHIFSYLIPFTDDAFVVTNIAPIAADVEGYITHLYVKNGQAVKKGEPLFMVYQKPYRLAYQHDKAKYEEALEEIKVIQRKTDKTVSLLRATEFELKKARYNYLLKSDSTLSLAVSAMEIKDLLYTMQAMEHQKISLQQQVAIEKQKIQKQKKTVKALNAQMNNAKVNLDLTTVRAPADGMIDNMYISVGTPIKIHQPLFSFIDTAHWWIQANFNETDLRKVRVGDKVTIILRMYYWDRIFHGRVVNNIWAADRQVTSERSQQQKVSNENQWLLLPQRFPLQIEILDPDPKYPLNPGASAYVYIHT